MDENFQYDEDGGTVTFSDQDEYKHILMMQLGRICQLGSKEMRGGYFTKVTTQSGEEKEVYNEDTRETYSSAVLVLLHLMLKNKHKQLKDVYNDFIKHIQELKEEFIKGSSVEETEILSEKFYVKSHDKILLEEYRIKKLEVHRVLFVELNAVISASDFMGTPGGTD